MRVRGATVEEKGLEDLGDVLICQVLHHLPQEQLLGTLQCVSRRMARLAVASLPENLQLRGLQMRGKRLRGVLNVLERGVKECYVKCLDLRDNGLEDEDGIELAKYINAGILPNLRFLDLTANHLEYLGARAVVSASAKAYINRGDLSISLRLNKISAKNLDKVASEPWEIYDPTTPIEPKRNGERHSETLRMDVGAVPRPIKYPKTVGTSRQLHVDVVPQDNVLNIHVSRANPLLLRSLLSQQDSGGIESNAFLLTESFFLLNFQFRTRPTSKLERLFEVVWWKYQERSWHTGVAQPSNTDTEENLLGVGQASSYEYLVDPTNSTHRSSDVHVYRQWNEQLSFYKIDLHDGRAHGPLRGDCRLYEEGVVEDTHLVWVESSMPRPLLLTM
mmetsp:Transcript_11276/g.69687  ORF Transcript_11276/g.69687 Transcript_11276/m.69687 type:complete len:390 (-) Transcript_11276:2379-3548(-)